jgi:hypothetical protein
MVFFCHSPPENPDFVGVVQRPYDPLKFGRIPSVIYHEARGPAKASSDTRWSSQGLVQK